MARGVELAGVLVDAKNDCIIRLLIGNDEEGTGRVDVEVARPLAPGQLGLEQSECALRGIDCEDGDAVVAAIRSVEKPARRVNHDLRRIVLSFEFRR